MLSLPPIILAITYIAWLKASIKMLQNFSRRNLVVGTMTVYSGSVYSKMHERHMKWSSDLQKNPFSIVFL